MKFNVGVIECNAQTFRDNYRKYIKGVYYEFGNFIFTMRAPHTIYNEIDKLKDNCIYIL